MDHLPSAVVVVVPARDEEELLPRCLASLAVAGAAWPTSACAPRSSWSPTPAPTAPRTWRRPRGRRCSRWRSDASGPPAPPASSTASGPPGPHLHATWLAHTDADSVVPADWLLGQLQHATRGADAVLGTVRLAGAEDGEPVPATHQSQVDRWAERYVAQLLPDLTHPHVHGANLGVRADAYLAVGGFDDLDLHEDHVLAARLRAAGHHVVTTSLDPVVTSHRLQGRVDGGVATDLRSA